MQPILKLILLCSAVYLSLSAPASANSSFAGGQFESANVEQSERTTQALQAACSNPACSCDIAKQLIAENEATAQRLVVDMNTEFAQPIRTDEIDCVSGLIDANFNLGVPSLESIARSILNQLKQAACNIVVSQARQLIGGAGLNYNERFKNVFPIPGTDETITIDAGRVDTGVDPGVSNQGSQNGTTGGINASAANPVNSGIDINAGGSAGAATNIQDAPPRQPSQSTTDDDDLDSFLDGIFQ